MPPTMRVSFNAESEQTGESVVVGATVSEDLDEVVAVFERFLRGAGFSFDSITVARAPSYRASPPTR